MGNASARDEQRARALYAEHGAALLTFTSRLLDGDRALAEDIVQETLLRAWRKGRRIRAEARRQWLFTTARHLVIDAYRARRARPRETLVAEVDEDSVSDEDTTDGLDAVLDGILMADALEALTPAHRSVVVDCFYRGRTAAEVASARDLPAGTVRSRLYYALRALQLALQERGVTGP